MRSNMVSQFRKTFRIGNESSSNLDRDLNNCPATREYRIVEDPGDGESGERSIIKTASVRLWVWRCWNFDFRQQKDAQLGN